MGSLVGVIVLPFIMEDEYPKYFSQFHRTWSTCILSKYKLLPYILNLVLAMQPEKKKKKAQLKFVFAVAAVKVFSGSYHLIQVRQLQCLVLALTALSDDLH